jgi:hypothetical protein
MAYIKMGDGRGGAVVETVLEWYRACGYGPS